MSEQKQCIRCERAIDQWSKLCPFCNWDQNNADVPAQTVAPKQVIDYKPEDDLKEQLKRKGRFAGAGVLVLVASFLIGMVINSDDAVDEAPVPIDEQAEKVAPVRKADTPLVPTGERGGIEQPITSAPVGEATPQQPSNGYDRSDATAVSSSEYNQLAQKAKKERERMSAIVDPRTITGAAYAQSRRTAPPVRQTPPQQLASAQGLPVPPGAAPQATAPPLAGNDNTPPPPAMKNEPAQPRPRRAAIRTRPVPVHQPLPQIYARGNARLTLIIGADGRVRDVNIEKPLSRNTADLVAAVQRWRFKPATEDGEPVSAPYSVDINFGQ